MTRLKVRTGKPRIDPELRKMVVDAFAQIERVKVVIRNAEARRSLGESLRWS